MSGTLGDLMLNSARYLTGEQPKMLAEVPYIQAQTAETQARVPWTQAQTGLTQAQTTKAQLDAESARLLLEQNRQGILQSTQGGGATGYVHPADATDAGQLEAPTAAPGGGGRAIGPGSGPPRSGSDALALATPPAPVPGGPAQVMPSTMLAMQTRPSGAPPGAPQGPPPQLGFGGDASGGPIMIGQTTAQPAAMPTVTVTPQGASSAPAPAAAAPGSAQLPPTMRTSPNGQYFPPLGQVAPRDLITNYWTERLQGTNVSEALNHLRAQRNQRILQLAYNARDPQSWRQATESALDQGLISEDEYSHIHVRPDLRQSVIRGAQTDEQNARQDETMRQQKYAWDPNRGRYVFDPALTAEVLPVETPLGDYVNGTWVPRPRTPAQQAAESGQPILGGAGGAGAGGAGGGGPPAGSTTFDAYAGALKGHENPSGDHNVINSSGHYGDFQLGETERVTTARKYLPDVVKGMTDQQIIANKFTPEQQYQLLQGYTADHAAALQQMGQRPSGAALFLAHYLGPGAVSTLRQYSTDTPLSSIPSLRAAVAANPELGGNTTVGGLIEYAQRKFGNNTMTNDDIMGRVQVAGPGGGGGGGGPTQAPAGTAKPQAIVGTGPQLEADKARIDSDYAAAHDAQTAGRAATTQTMTVMDVLHRLPNIAPGAGGEWRAGMERLMYAVAPQRFQDWVQWATGHKFEDAIDRDAAIKEFTSLALQQESQMPGVRSGIGLAEMNAHASPNINMPEKTIHDLLNAILVRNQAVKDFGEGFAGQIAPRYQAWRQPTGGAPPAYMPVQPEWEAEWNRADSAHAPIVYQAAVDLMNGHSQQELEKWYGHLNPAQQKEVGDIVRRANPQFRPGNEQVPQ